MRRLMVKISVVVMLAAAALVVGGPAASAGGHRFQPPDLVALGDSFAAGTGNYPYIGPPQCGRSANDAYSEVLARLRLVTLQAFPACGGATTQQVIDQGQLDDITKDTDIVTVQALGNDFGFGELATLCAAGDCSADQPFRDGTVEDLLRSIPEQAKENLATLYGAITDRLNAVGSTARVIVVDYGNPFPSPTGWVGPLCPYMTAGELDVAKRYADSVNAALAAAAPKWDFTYLDAAPRFRGLDVCGFASVFFRPLGLPGAPPDGQPYGVFHPNKAGQGIYAGVLTGRLFF